MVRLRFAECEEEDENARLVWVGQRGTDELLRLENLRRAKPGSASCTIRAALQFKRETHRLELEPRQLLLEVAEQLLAE